MKFDHTSGDLQLIWNTFLDFEAFTREADGDLNCFIEEWKEKMIRVQSAGCQYSELLLGLKLLEKVNLSSDSIMSIISKLGSSHSNSDNFLVQVVTNLQAESGINGSSVDDKEKNNKSGTNEFNQEISVELDIKNNIVSCFQCPEKFFGTVSLSKHYQEFHPNENQEKVLISKKDLKPDPDFEEHQKGNDNDVTLESVVQVWVGSPERGAENAKDDPLMSDEIKMEINSVIGFKSDINNVQEENESSDHTMSNSSDKFRCDICSREFTTVANLRKHMVSHKTSVDFTCYHCGKSHETKLALYNHVRQDHSNEPHYGPKKFPCNICGQQVAHAQKDKHMLKHFSDPIKCEICGKEFKAKCRLNYHMDNHRKTKDFMCSHCGMRFQSRTSLYVHKRIKHEKDKNKQGETAAEDVNESNLKSSTTNRQINVLKNIEGIQEEGSDSSPTDENLSLAPANSVPCKTCGKFVAKTFMSSHKKLHMENVFKCSICQKEFNLARYLRAHLKTHKETNDHICPYCSKSFKTSSSLRKHIKIVCKNNIPSSDNNSQAEEKFPAEKEIKPLSLVAIKTEIEGIFSENPCDISGENMKKVVEEKETIDQSLSEVEGKIRKLITKQQMGNHVKVHGLSDICQCEICGKRFHKYTMARHIKVHRPSVQCPCEVCGAVVEDRKMKKHLKKHYVKHVCGICQKQFKTRGHLTAHKETHNATNEYICSFCGKKYKTKLTLNEHINQHTKARPLPCKFCDKIFYCHGARRFHIRAHHTGEKPYKCDICDKRFYISSRKIQHMRKHTGEKPFSCDECGKNYSDASSLKKHVNTVHKEV